MPEPLISVGMPVRNGEDFVEETLNSLLSQTFRDFELIISDNASEDRTSAICRACVSADSRVSYHRFETNVGAARNYNYVFEQARGKFFKWASHDDVCLPEFIEKCLAEFRTAPNAVVVYPRTELIDEHGNPLGRDTLSLAVHDGRAYSRLANFFEHIHLANPLLGLIRADALARTRLIDSFIKSDLVLLAELLMLGRFIEVPEILFRRRLHQKRSLAANRTERELVAWFDPNRREKLPLRLRLALEYTRSVSRVPMPLADRLGCVAVTARYTWWSGMRSILSYCKQSIPQAITRKQ